MKISPMFSLIFLLGCTASERIALRPEPDTCQLDHTQTTLISAYGSLVCWDDKKEMKGVALARGTSVGEVFIDIGKTAAVAGIAAKAIGGIETGTDLSFEIPGQ